MFKEICHLFSITIYVYLRKETRNRLINVGIEWRFIGLWRMTVKLVKISLCKVVLGWSLSDFRKHEYHINGFRSLFIFPPSNYSVCWSVLSMLIHFWSLHNGSLSDHDNHKNKNETVYIHVNIYLTDVDYCRENSIIYTLSPR